MSIPQRKIGSDSVACVGFGAMGLTSFYGATKPQETTNAIIEALTKHAGSGKAMIDTSDIYTARPSLGQSEESIGEAFNVLPGAREKIFLATKHGFIIGDKGERGVRGGTDYCLSACDASLKRLGVEQIDLFYIHRPIEPVEETSKGFLQLKKEGKVRYTGVSEFNLDQLQRAHAVCPIDVVQIEMSIWTPDIVKNGMLDWCKKNNVVVAAYSPVGRGFLSGTLKSRADFEQGDFRLGNPRFSEENFAKNLDLVSKVEKFAEKKGVTAAQVALAWVLHQGDNIIPIPGTTKLANLEENMQAANVKLTKDELAEIDAIIDSFSVSGGRYPKEMSALNAF